MAISKLICSFLFLCTLSYGKLTSSDLQICGNNTAGERCERCADGYFGDATRGTPEDCTPCPCPLITPPNQFSPTCFLDNDGQPTCNACLSGYVGRRCEKCAEGYRRAPTQTGGRCEPTTEINDTRTLTPPRVTIEPYYQEVTVGDPVEFRCISEGFPEPLLRWTGGRNNQLNPQSTFVGGFFRISSARKTDEAEYFCSATNAAGSESVRTILLVREVSNSTENTRRGEEPPLTISPMTYEAQRLQTVKFQCHSTASSTSSMEWSFLGGQLPEDSSQIDGVLTLPQVTEDHQGVYVCTARNSHGISRAQARLLIASYHSTPTARVEPEQQTLIQGFSGELKCIVSGIPKPTVNWSKIGEELSNRHKLQDDNLQISNITVEDRGLYVCTAENSAGSVRATALVEVERREVPAIELYPEATQTVIRGGSALFQCRVTAGIPTPTVEWVRADGSAFTSSTEILNGGVIRFNRVTGEEEGTYICKAKNSGGRTNSQAVLQIQDTVRLSHDYVKKEETAFVGSSIQLQCPVSGLPSSQFDWSKDGESMPNNARVVNNQLWLRDVQMENAGRYLCTVTNLQGRTRDYVVLNVKGVSTVDVKIEANKVVVNMGDTLDLRCKVTGDASARISWYKISQNGPLPENVRIRENILVINGVMSENGGVYRCNVESRAGTFSDDYVVTIQIPPTITPDLTEPRTAPVGSTVVIDCQTTLDPTVAYTWYKQGGVLPSDATVNEGQLTIANVKGDDAGTYICSARSHVGIIDIPTILIVTGVIPYFSQTPLSYMKLPTLTDAYLSFSIVMSFKPESMNGLLFYNGQKHQGDFVALTLSNGYVEFKFELGSGPAVIRSNEPVSMGKWHTVKITRERKNGTLRVDNQHEVTGSSQGRLFGLNLAQPMYVGSVPDFSTIELNASTTTGFIGCISHFRTEKVVHNLLREAEAYGISTCETCSKNPCLNSGVCQEALTTVGYTCICPPGSSGQDCERVSEACYPGVCGEGRCFNKRAGGFECFCPMGKSGLRCEKDIILVEPEFLDDVYGPYHHRSSKRK